MDVVWVFPLLAQSTRPTPVSEYIKINYKIYFYVKKSSYNLYIFKRTRVTKKYKVFPILINELKLDSKNKN